MARPVFISYARGASAAEAMALADNLGDLAFFDTEVIDDGDHFPRELLEGVLDARVVVIFATKTYIERRFCRLEMRLALAGCDPGAEQVVVALGDGAEAVLDGLPASAADQSWPAAGERDRLGDLVRDRLQRAIPIRGRLAKEEARKLAVAFLEESKTPEPRPLHEIFCSLPPGVATQSIGGRFVGRAEALRRIHRTLWEGRGGVAQLTSRISAGGGFGKTRLASEYVHRYGASYYPGGVFWVNAGAKAPDVEFWRVLSAINETTPDLATLRAQGRNINRELERALRGIGKPTLYVVDDIPEAGPGEDPASIGKFCPALGAVTVLATSRQDTREPNVRTIALDTLGGGAAILLLTEGVAGAAALSWAEWGRIATWVGHLPLFLDLLNRSLALNSITPRELLQRADKVEAHSRTAELDSLREALRGQVPEDSVGGVTETFSISFEKLDDAAKEAAKMLGQLAAAPIPEALFKALPEKLKGPGVRAALHSRHFVTSGGGPSFGVMHRMMTDFLRTITEKEEPHLLLAACLAQLKIMTPDRCLDPKEWPLMNLCRPHAEVLVERGLKRNASVTVSGKLGLLTANLASAQGDYAGARRLEEQVVDVMTRVLGKEDPDTLTAMSNLAETLREQGDYPDARRLQKQVLEVRTRVLWKEDPDTLTSMSNLAETLRAEGDYVEARRLQEQVLEVRTRVFGKEDPDALTLMNNLALTLGNQGDHAGAGRLLKQVLEVRTRVLGKEHPDTLISMNSLAATLRAEGDHVGARRLLDQVLEVVTRVLGKEHPDTLMSMSSLAETLRAEGDDVGARRLHEDALEMRTRVLGKEHPNTLRSMWFLALTLRHLGERAAALRILRDCLDGRRRVLGDEHPDTIATAKFITQFQN